MKLETQKFRAATAFSVSATTTSIAFAIYEVSNIFIAYACAEASCRSCICNLEYLGCQQIVPCCSFRFFVPLSIDENALELSKRTEGTGRRVEESRILEGRSPNAN